MAKSGLDLNVYRMLGELEGGFAQVRSALLDLSSSHLFPGSELSALARFVEESRATLSSYLLGVLEDVETREAGRLFRKRTKEERKNDSGER
jgi:hypothetical protein